MWQKGWRDQLWSELEQPWDVLIIGGGITGAGILREASRAGLRALLVEAHDFASGTSSRSSKLVHGGFRYLKNGQIKLTFESVRERERLLKEGRGLVNPLGFLLANYRGDAIPGWVFGAALVLYDLLAFQWGHRHYDAYDMHELCPPLTSDGLRGGYRYFDAQTDDARLVLRLIQESVAEGGAALNYTRAGDLLRNRQGQVRGAVTDRRNAGWKWSKRRSPGACGDQRHRRLGGRAAREDRPARQAAPLARLAPDPACQPRAAHPLGQLPAPGR